MRTDLAYLVLLFAPALLRAADIPLEPVTKVIHVQHGSPEAIRDALATPRLSLHANNSLQAIVASGAQADVDRIEQLVHELDVPSSADREANLELTMYIVGASNGGAPEPVSRRDLEPVWKQIRASGSYSNYTLLDSVVIRSKEHRFARISGQLPIFSAGEPEPNRYSVDCSFGSKSETQRGGAGTHIDKSSFRAGPLDRREVSLETNLDVQDGQTVVVGNTNVDGGKSSVFVVVAVKFVS